MPLLIDKTLPAYEDAVRRVELRRPSILEMEALNQRLTATRKIVGIVVGEQETAPDDTVVVSLAELEALIGFLSSITTRIVDKAEGETEDKAEIRDYLEHLGATVLIGRIYAHFAVMQFARDNDIDRLEALLQVEQERAQGEVSDGDK